MNAIVIHAPHELSFQSVALPPMTPTSVRVKTRLTSISAGTERMTLAGRLPGMPQLQYPLIPGYENVGVVTAVGDDVDPSRLAVGDRVFLPGTVGHPDIFSVFGGQVSESVNHADRPVKLPAALGDETALLLALGATAHHGVRRCIEFVADRAELAAADRPLAGRRALVLGQGVVGQLAARILAEYGATVAVADIHPFRVGLSEADEFITIADAPADALPKDAFDVVFEASGAPAAFDAAVHALKRRGLLLVLGFYESLVVSFGPAFIKEIHIAVSGEWDAQDMTAALNWLSRNDAALHQLVTHQLPANNPARAYDVALNDPECLKIALTW
jgi:bacteriochlorophyllide a dehydrogenase